VTQNLIVLVASLPCRSLLVRLLIDAKMGVPSPIFYSALISIFC
jgi:hypothetical protein